MAERILVKIAVDLDPVPGAFSTEELAKKVIQEMLLMRIPFYNPVVLDSTEADS